MNWPPQRDSPSMLVSCGKFQARELTDACHVGYNPLFIRESLKRAFIQFLFCHATGHEIGNLRNSVHLVDQKIEKGDFLSFYVFFVLSCSLGLF